jgi:hypothetical protein
VTPAGRVRRPAVLVAAWLAAFALSRGAGEPSPSLLLGAAGLAVAAGATWLLPGWLLARRLGLAGGPWWETAPIAFGLGLGWLLLPAAAVLLLGQSVPALIAIVLALDAALILAELRWPSPTPSPPRPPAPHPALLAVVLLAVVALALASAPGLGFTASGDDWTQMASVRAFLDAPAITDTFDFDAWDLVLAALVRLGRPALVDACRLLLPPLLIAAGLLSFHLLARTLQDDADFGALAVGLLALHALSDMHTRGEGLGMGLLVRILEDKHAAAFVLVPLAQAAALRGLRAGDRRWLACAAVVSLSAVVVHPLSAVWLALSLGVTAAVALATRTVERTPARLALALTLPAALVVLAAGLRALRPAAYFRLYEPSWPYNAAFLRLSQNQLWILSLEDGWFLADPRLLAHPFMAAAVVAALALLGPARRSLGAAFLVAGALAPVALAYNPLTARLLGALITPWMLYRVLWVVPAALILAWTARLALARWFPAPRRAPAAALLVLVLAALLGPRLTAARQAARVRNHVRIDPGERAFLEAIGRDPRLGGVLLAPLELGVRLPAFTTRLQPLAGLDGLRRGDPGPAEEVDQLLAPRAFGADRLEMLRERGVTHVAARTGARLDHVLRAQPAAFRPVWQGEELTLFAFRPERAAAR